MCERWVIGTLQNGRKVSVNMARVFGIDRIETDHGLVTILYSGIDQQFNFACLEPPEHFLPHRRSSANGRLAVDAAAEASRDRV